MKLFTHFKGFLLKKFVVFQDLKDTKKEIKDIKHILSLLMDHYWDIDASKALPAKGILRMQQLKGCEILNDIAVALEKEKISYWLEYGTLLGSVRHKGFVPWDDDIDLGALQKDTDKIIEAINNTYPGKYSFRFVGDIDKFLKVEFFEDNRLSVVDIILYKQDGERLSTRVFKLAKVYNRPFPYDIIFPLVKGEFEGKTYNIPNNTHLYLKKNYGDYMTIPKKAHVYEHSTWDSHEIFYKD